MPGAGDARDVHAAVAVAIETVLMPDPLPQAAAARAASRYSVPTFSDPDALMRDEVLADSARSRAWARAALAASGHFAAAGEPRRAGLYRLVAARAAVRGGRPAHGFRLANESAAALEPGSDHAAAAAALLEVARGYPPGESDDALLAVVRAETRVAYGRRPEEQRLAATAKLIRAQRLEQAGRMREAAEAAATALSALRVIPGAPGSDEALTLLGNAHWRKQETPDAARRAGEALEIRKRTGDLAGEGTSWSNIALSHWKMGNLQASFDAFDKSVAICARTGDRIGEAQVLGNRAIVERAAGNRDGMMATHQRVRELQRSLGERHHEALMVANQGIYARMDGDFVTARERCHEARQLFLSIGASRFVGLMRHDEAVLDYLEERYEACVGALELAYAAAEAGGARDLQADVLAFRALALARLGKPEAAAEFAGRAKRAAQQTGNAAPATLADAAEALVRVDPVAAATSGARARQAGDAVTAAFALRIATDLYESRGAFAEARIAAQEEIEFGKAEDTQYIVLQAQERLARLFGRVVHAAAVFALILLAAAGCGHPGIVPDVKLELVQTIGARGKAPGQFESPQGIACGTDGSLYVADRGNGRVQEFAQDGTLARVIGSYGDPYLKPGCCRSSKVIQKTWAENGGPGHGRFAEPIGVALDKTGSLWVLDAAANLLSRFDPEGVFQEQFMGELYAPGDITIAPWGNLVITNAGGADVQIYQPTGKQIIKLYEHGSRPGQVVDPNSAIADRDGNYYVVDTGNRRIQRIAPNGRQLLSWAPTDAPRALFRRMLIHPSGYVYVTDEGSRCVWILDRRLRLKARAEFVHSAQGDKRLQRVFGVAVAPGGDIYLSDVHEHVVYRCRAFHE